MVLELLVCCSLPWIFLFGLFSLLKRTSLEDDQF